MVADPQELWQAAVQLANSYTSAAGKHALCLTLTALVSWAQVCKRCKVVVFTPGTSTVYKTALQPQIAPAHTGC
jgi:hypothetical protein